MSEQWYVLRVDGTIDGPYSERSVSHDLMTGKIVDPQRVRQGASGAWCDAPRARAVFQQLAQVGWYVRAAGDLFGPFTEDKLLGLHQTGDLAPGSELRQGLLGKWKSAEAVLSLWQQQKVPRPNHGLTEEDAQEVTKWSVEPIRHVVMPLESTQVVPDCQRFERLLLDYPRSEEADLVVTKTNGQRVGYLNENNSRQVIANAERGLSHVTLLYSVPNSRPLEVAIVLCPPGVAADACRQYIDDQFRFRSNR